MQSQIYSNANQDKEESETWISPPSLQCVRSLRVMPHTLHVWLGFESCVGTRDERLTFEDILWTVGGLAWAYSSTQTENVNVKWIGFWVKKNLKPLTFILFYTYILNPSGTRTRSIINANIYMPSCKKIRQI